MKAYQNSRFIEYPDAADVQQEGRASHVGKLRERSGEFKPYIRNAQKRRSIRRSLKRSDKGRTIRLDEYDFAD